MLTRRLKKPTVIEFSLTDYGREASVKKRHKIDLWLKSVAPSNELRKWFGHDPDRFAEFSERYRAELTASGALDELRAVLKEHPTATLLFAAHDEEHNNAVVLQHLLETE